MKTRPPKDFNQLISTLRQYVFIQECSAWDNEVGNHSFFARGKINICYNDEKKQKNSSQLPVAITRLKKTTEFNASRKAMKLLREKSNYSGIGPPPFDLTFIQTYLYFSEKARIAELGDSDMIQYLTKNPDATINIKELIAQMILAISALHAQNLVHRDIKLENFIVFLLTKSSIKIKLIDLDDIADHNDLTLHLDPAGTPAYFAPEISSHNWGQRSDDNILDLKKYIHANKKAVDCYALGTAIYFLTLYLEYPICKRLMSLIQNLTLEDPEKRLTIEEAKQHVYFGTTTKKSNLYFHKIQEKFALPKDAFFDGYYRSRINYTPEEGDAFLLLPKNIKDIYLLACDVSNQLDSIKNPKLYLDDQSRSYDLCYEPHRYYNPIDQYNVNESTLNAIMKKASQLQKQLFGLLPTARLNNIIQRLQKAVEDIIAFINELSLLRISTLPPAYLIHAVEDAILIFAKTSKKEFSSNSNSFFSKYYQRRAFQDEYKKSIELLKQLKEMQSKSSFREMLVFIITYYHLNNTARPRKKPEKLFTAQLMTELRAISSQPLEDWVKQLSGSEKHSVEREYKIPSSRNYSGTGY